MESKVTLALFLILLFSSCLCYKQAPASFLQTEQACTSGFSAQERLDLIKMHNSYRNSIASGQVAGFPSAANMNELAWDSELETLAQNWANTGPLGHNPSRSIPSHPTDWIGENIFWAMGTGVSSMNLTVGVQNWYNEINGYTESISNFTAGQQPNGAVVGHFTQVIWATTKRVGCGVLRCSSNVTLVCDYWVGGNFLYNPVYVAGTAKSKCPAPSTNWTSLCAPS